MWLLQVVVEFVLLVLAECVVALFRRSHRGGRRVESIEARIARAKAIRRDRAIRRWLKRKCAQAPIPRIGLHCPNCGYELTGLTTRVCPECGRPFDIREFLNDHAEGGT